MRKFCMILSLIYVCITNCQEKRKFYNGIVVLDKTPIGDVHITNKNTNKGTISNNKGEFSIPISLGDSLHFSHINLKSKLLIITPKHISENKIVIVLKEETYTLDEVVLGKPKSIFYVDPQIMPPPEVNAKTLRLPYANTKAKKDNSIMKFSSGSLISLNNLINTLNGNLRREKQLKKLIHEDKTLEKIRKFYTDDFFVTDLKIKKEYINQFLNSCIDKNIIGIFKNDNKINLTNFLIEESKFYTHKVIYEGKPVTKQ